MLLFYEGHGVGIALKHSLEDPSIDSKLKQFSRRFASVVVSLARLLKLVLVALSARLKKSLFKVEPGISLFDRALLYAKRALILFFLTSFVSVIFYRWIPVGVTPLMIFRVAESSFNGKVPKWKKQWVSISKISPRMQAAVIAAEDQYFFEHNGVDWRAVEKAMEHNQRSRRVRGASTISQQVAKNVFLWPDRSWIRKGLELYFTGLLEATWSKKRILEVYLNVVEMGDGIYGVEAAAQAYFRKPASKLNSDESALIAAILPNPRMLSASKPTGYVRFRQSLIRRRLNQVKLEPLDN